MSARTAPEKTMAPARPLAGNASSLLAPFSLGPVRLPNRIVMAPLTRAS